MFFGRGSGRLEESRRPDMVFHVKHLIGVVVSLGRGDGPVIQARVQMATQSSGIATMRAIIRTRQDRQDTLGS